MISLAVALGLAGAPDATDLAVRMRDSAAAAQALQGPLDGTWILLTRERPLYVIQLTDPAGGSGPLTGAWRGPGASASIGLIDAIVRRGDSLTIQFAASGVVVRVLLRRDDGTWIGTANENGRDRGVVLRRSPLADLRPPLRRPDHR
jgi:hypothetical protein